MTKPGNLARNCWDINTPKLQRTIVWVRLELLETASGSVDSRIANIILQIGAKLECHELRRMIMYLKSFLFT